MVKWLAAGVAGLFALSASAASAATTSCSTVAACVFGSNSSSGIGVEGNSKSGFGVSGVSSSGHGVNGTSSSSFGVVGITTENATSTGTARAGVLGEDSSTNKKAFNTGVAGSSTYGIGVTGSGGSYGGKFTGGNGLFATAVDADPDGFIGQGYRTNFPGAVNAYGEYDDGGALPFTPDVLFQGIGCFVTPDNEYPECGPSATINADGSASFGGPITSAGSTVYATKTGATTAVASYGSRLTSPTLEDLGKGTLRAGVAYVPIEPVFASTIDAAAGYLVFITPEGNSHGLYTTQLTPRGFAVRENDGGKSSLTFDYRIVAHPADTKKARLAAMPRMPRVLRSFRRKS